MTAALAGLRALAESLPPDTPVPVPAGMLRELLESALPMGNNAAADPTVEEIGARYGRAPSTIRGWCEARRFPRAYKLHDREWRIPTAALEAFDGAQRQRHAGAPRRRVTSFADFRRHLRKAE